METITIEEFKNEMATKMRDEFFDSEEEMSGAVYEFFCGNPQLTGIDFSVTGDGDSPSKRNKFFTDDSAVGNGNGHEGAFCDFCESIMTEILDMV